MKLPILLIPLTLLVLTGCNSNSNGTSNDTVTSSDTKQSITLSVDNFSTYVATNSYSAPMNNGQGAAIYYTYFIGADYCKYVDCTVSYKYVSSFAAETPIETIKLTISGDGEANPYYIRKQTEGIYWYIAITGASGTVEIYR